MEPGKLTTILVVEDEAIIRMSTIATLEDAGLCVMEAGNSAEALELLARHAEISLLVTDVRMPGAMDGLALVSQVQREQPCIRAIVVSGNANASQAYRAGAAEFIRKPYLAQTLVRTVLSLVPPNSAPLGCAA